VDERVLKCARDAAREYLEAALKDSSRGAELLARTRLTRIDDLEALNTLISDSRSSVIAFDACVLLVQRFQVKGPVPDPLIKFHKELLGDKRRRPRGRGRTRADKFLRDMFICEAIEQAIAAAPSLGITYDYDPPHSACGVVSELMVECGYALSYVAIKKIWSARNK